MSIMDGQLESALRSDPAALDGAPTPPLGAACRVIARWELGVDPGEAWVEWTIERDAEGCCVAWGAVGRGDEARVAVRAGGAPAAPAIAWRTDEARGLEHIDVAGALWVTLRRGTGSSPLELIYARSSLVDAAPPGCCDHPQCHATAGVLSATRPVMPK